MTCSRLPIAPPAPSDSPANRFSVGKKLKADSFDLDKELDIQVDLRALSGECRSLKTPLTGKVRISADGESKIDYQNDIK